VGALERKIAEQRLANERVLAQQRAYQFTQGAEQAAYERGQRPQQEQLTALQILQARAGLESTRLGTAMNRFQLQQAQLEAAAPKPVLPYGEPPKGTFPVQSPTGEIQYIPQPGTEPYRQAEDAVRTQENLIRDLQLFQTSVEKAGASGTEWIGDQANMLRFQRGNVVAGLAKLRNLGVLQPGEYEILEQQLPDPTSIMRNLGGVAAAFDFTGISADAMREAIQAPYSAFRQLAEDRLKQSYKTYWYVQPVPGILPETAR
jgi:hypothetical protein